MPLPLDNVDSLLKRNLAVCGRPVSLAIEVRIIRNVIKLGQKKPRGLFSHSNPRVPFLW